MSPPVGTATRYQLVGGCPQAGGLLVARLTLQVPLGRFFKVQCFVSWSEEAGTSNVEPVKHISHNNVGDYKRLASRTSAVILTMEVVHGAASEACWHGLASYQLKLPHCG